MILQNNYGGFTPILVKGAPYPPVFDYHEPNTAKSLAEVTYLFIKQNFNQINVYSY